MLLGEPCLTSHLGLLYPCPRAGSNYCPLLFLKPGSSPVSHLSGGGFLLSAHDRTLSPISQYWFLHAHTVSACPVQGAVLGTQRLKSLDPLSRGPHYREKTDNCFSLPLSCLQVAAKSAVSQHSPAQSHQVTDISSLNHRLGQFYPFPSVTSPTFFSKLVTNLIF